MKKLRFLRAVQERTARVAVGPSSARGQGDGVILCARKFLSSLRIETFATRDRRRFEERLDNATERLAASFPRGCRNWGTARKLLNLFLRDCLYTQYLAKASRLSRAERLLELPLDSITATELRRRDSTLPRWPGVKHLRSDVSAAYQSAAARVAREQGLARVHLDTFWWGQRD